MSSQKCPFLWGYVPRTTHGSFSPPSLQPNRQLDRFSRFRRAHLLVYYRSDSPIVVHTKREHRSALRCIPSRYVTSQLGQLSLASLRGCSIEYQLNFAGVNAGMSPLPVTLCDPIYGMQVPVAVRRVANCCRPTLKTHLFGDRSA